MNIKKPKFWDYKKPNLYSYLLLPITLIIRIFNFFKIVPKNKKNKIKMINYNKNQMKIKKKFKKQNKKIKKYKKMQKIKIIKI